MQRGKIAFGKISLRLNAQDSERSGEESIDTELQQNEQETNTSAKTADPPTDSVSGFKKVDKIVITPSLNRREINDAEMDNQKQLREVMGISGFGHKAAKIFDIDVI